MKVSDLQWADDGTTEFFRHPTGRSAWVQRYMWQGAYTFFVDGTTEFDRADLDTFGLAMLLAPCTPISPSEETP